MRDLLLVPSPLLGPATWAPVADALRSRNQTVRVAAPEAVNEPTDIVDAVVSAAAGRDVVLVPHSNAGYYVPQLSSVVGVVAAVFVDAALPLERGATTLAPADFLATLRELADEDGVLPPWTEWWEDVSAVFPDPAIRAAVEAEQKRLPLSYFTARLPVPDNWTELPCAYLAFGDSYAAERAFASEHAWPTRTLVGGHLHQLHDPDTVASAILDLLDALIP